MYDTSMRIGVRLFWSIVLGFLFGVFVRSLIQLGISHILFIALLSLATGILVIMDRISMRAVVIPVFLAAMAFGVLRMHFGVIEGTPILDSSIGETITLEGVVVDEPDVRNANTRVAIRVSSVASTSVQGKVYVLAIANPYIDVAYGNNVRVKGIVERPESFDVGAGRLFNYPGYLASQGISYQIARAEIHMVGEGNRNVLKAGALAIKRRFTYGLTRSLPEPFAGLAGGITVGDKRALGPDLTEQFKVASLVHIIVLSGYNITIVISVLLSIASSLPRWLKFLIGSSVAIFFAVMTGGASASVRAAAMACVAMTASLTGRVYLAERTLFLVAGVMVVWNPYLLVFDPGFQLSFVATLGLVYFSPIIASHFSWIPERLSLREIFSSSVSAQVAVLPLLLHQSGQLSLVALPANLFALVAVPYAMFASLIAGVGGLFFGPLSAIIALPAYVLLSYIIAIARIFSHIPYASVAIPSFSVWWLVVMYAALFLLFYISTKTIPADRSAA